MEMNKLLLMLLILFCIPIVMGATQDYEIVVQVEEDLISGENNDVGTFLFKKLDPVSEIIDFNTCSNITIGNYDKLNWVGTAAYIELSNGLTLIKNNPRTIISETQLTYICDAETYEIVVVPLVQPSINISTIRINGFDIVYNKNNFILNNDEIVDIEIDVDEDILVTEYPIIFNFGNKNHEIRFEIVEDKSYSVQNSTINSSVLINAGDSQHIGNLKVENIGNVNFELNLTTKGNGSELLIYPELQTLFRNTYSLLNFNVLVPSTHSTGNYTAELYIDDDNIKNITIMVKDNSIPTIEDVTFDKEVLFVDCELSAIVKDNIEVNKVEVTINNDTYQMIKDNQLYTFKNKYTNKTVYNFTMCAYDNQLNKACVKFEKEFSPLQPFNNITNEKTMPTLQQNKNGKRMILNLTEDVDINITLTNFFNTVNANFTNYEIKLLDDENNYEFFEDRYNRTLSLYKGLNYIELNSGIIGDYYFDLEINTPDYVDTLKYIRIYGEVKNYTISDEFKLDWNGVENGFYCTNHDTGEFETSYKECFAKYPIDVEADDISIPTTVKERKKFDNDVKDLKEEYNNTTDRLSSFATFSFAALIILIIVMVFLIYIKPYVRFKVGKTITRGNNQNEKQ